MSINRSREAKEESVSNEEFGDHRQYEDYRINLVDEKESGREKKSENFEEPVPLRCWKQSNGMGRKT